jgi:hypothetical protein
VAFSVKRIAAQIGEEYGLSAAEVLQEAIRLLQEHDHGGA